MLLENKVVERLESEKKVFNEKMVPRLMKRKIQKNTLKIDFESWILALFDDL